MLLPWQKDTGRHWGVRDQGKVPVCSHLAPKAWQAYRAQAMGERWRGEGRIVCNWDGSPKHHDTPIKQWRRFADKHGFKAVRPEDSLSQQPDSSTPADDPSRPN